VSSIGDENPKVTGATIQDIIALVDGVKNVMIALAFVLMGFYVTIHPQGIPENLQTQWVSAAMLVGTVYIGGRQVTSAMIRQQQMQKDNI
jgi:hypothetical protein